MILVWCVVLAGGFGAMFVYSIRPGEAARVPAVFTPTLPGTTHARVHLFVHPRCPCTRSSVEQFERLLLSAGVSGGEDAVAYVCWDESDPSVLSSSGLVTRLGGIPGVRVVQRGALGLASGLGVRTSGHVIVVDTEGGVVFSGGLTSSRGHAGASDAWDAALGAVRGDGSGARFPVYGCPLFSPDACAELCGVAE